MALNWEELRRGLASARPFLLSHHPPAEYDRCYAPALRGRTIRLCARCVGIYTGILAGVLAALEAPLLAGGVVLVAVLPLPALFEWSLDALTPWTGSNPGRTATGLLLGYGYGLGLVSLFVRGTAAVAAVGVGYGILAAGLLAVHESRRG